jgi:hypothetical protein
MATAAEILNDPNYINANPATKRAIFERRIATLPEYSNANPATQKQIQTRFGVFAAAKAAPAPGPEVSGAEAAVLGFERGMKPVAEFARKFDPLAYLIDAAGIGAGTRNRIEQQLSAASQQAQQARPNYFAGGKIAGEIAATAPVIAAGGGMLTAAGRGVPIIERIGRAVSSGGIGSGRTAAQTAAMPLRQRQGQLVERAIGGAVAGAGGAALTGQDARTGAEFGAALPAAGSIARKVAGVLPDLANLPALQAARILRESLGDNLEAARAALSALPADAQELVRQTLVKANIEPRTFMGLAADVERLRPDQTAGILEGQAAARQARLARAGGGGSVEATRAAAREGRSEVSRNFTPAREAAFGRLSEVSNAEVLARAARQRAAQASALASGQEDMSRRLTGAASLFGDSPMFVSGADAASGRAAAATQEAAAQRATASQMEDYVYQAAAEGREPQNAAPIIAAFRDMAAQPGTRVDDLQRDTLLGIANKIQGAADQNGMINPYDLYQIRKTSISDFIGGLEAKITAGNAPKSGNAQRTEQLALSMRGQIDRMMGPEVQRYLADSAEGYAAVNRQELAGEASRLYNEDPRAATEFLALVGGNRPKTVKNIMGGGSENESFANAFANDPARLGAIQQSADEMRVLNRMGELSSQGSTAATELIGRERPFVSRALTRVGLAAFPPARIGADAAQVALASALKPRVQQQLAEAAVSGPNALALMNQYPSSLRMSEAVSNLSPGMRNALAQLLRGGTMNNQ